MIQYTAKALCSAVLLASVSTAANAAISETEASKLGKQLTPMGAIQAGNEDGTIPAWTGGVNTPPKGFRSGGHHPDPFANDEVLFKITADNYQEYAEKLTEGQKEMFELYPDTFYMNVYPTRRSAAYPDRIYDATREAATSAALLPEGNGVTGSDNWAGIPFPIPETGVEVIWNHILRYRGTGAAKRQIVQAVVNRDGGYNLVKFEDEFYPVYADPGITEDQLDNIIIYFKQHVISPARLAGGILLVHETLNQEKEHRKAWVYNPGQRRVRRAPNVAFDNPREASDGLATSDQFDMYNGSPERYNWELKGRQETFIPYNSYKLHSDSVTYDDVLSPLHINPELVRYELHRTWVVESTLKESQRHIYKRRTFYVDEDSWQVASVDIYDNRDELWRVSNGHIITYYDIPTAWTTVEEHVDLQSGRYLVIGMNNEEPSTYTFGLDRTAADYQPSSLRRAGRR
ncbi:MAG: DUF1329 domain-containing protein [Pseudomonadota bacterium]